MEWIAAVVMAAGLTAGQAVTNPGVIEFDASTDHDTIEQTVPILTSYIVEIYTPTGGSALTSVDIGKPTPVAGVITYTGLRAVYASLPPGTYVARVAASGPFGINRSDPSLPFDAAVTGGRAPAAPGRAPIIRVSLP